jgi:hypothetical protein
MSALSPNIGNFATAKPAFEITAPPTSKLAYVLIVAKGAALTSRRPAALPAIC